MNIGSKSAMHTVLPPPDASTKASGIIADSLWSVATTSGPPCASDSSFAASVIGLPVNLKSVRALLVIVRAFIVRLTGCVAVRGEGFCIGGEPKTWLALGPWVRRLLFRRAKSSVVRFRRRVHFGDLQSSALHNFTGFTSPPLTAPHNRVKALTLN